ncbi:MAG: hypothetical protein ACP5QI_09015, partial [Candidatus Bathyarchaeia archaeon]
LMEIAVKSSIAKVKWRANRCNSLEDYVNLAFSPSRFFPLPWISISPAQVKDEILALLKILVKHKPRSILEIGTAKGGTLFLFTRVASSDARIISIDLPGGRFGGGYPEWRIPFPQTCIFVYTFSFGALASSSVQPALQPSGTVGAYRYSFLKSRQEASALTANGWPHRRMPRRSIARLASLFLS